MTYSILFAETFPKKWNKEGVARMVLTFAWHITAMFVILIYLCNLRVHLIKRDEESVPRNIKEFMETNLKVYVPRQISMFTRSKNGMRLIEMGRWEEPPKADEGNSLSW